MAESEQNPPDRPYNTFLDKTILVTGATGFLGKVILERLLRMFEVDNIYVLIRSKHGQSGHERLKKILAGPLFDSVRELKGEKIFEKCHVINGDITKENLDISPEYTMLLKQNVEIVIHSAATVKFNEPLRKSIEINTSGTQRMLDLAKGMENLKAFVHISTAYCHPEEKVLYEKFYKSHADPADVMNLMKWMKETELETITPMLLNNLPNTYTFSKALAEDLVAKEFDNLPIIVVRPSIVVPIWKKPVAGWTDNINGPTGVLIAAGKGVIRTMYGNKDALADFISVDGVADTIFCIVSNFLITGQSQRVFNLCLSNEVALTWGEVIELGKHVGREEFPFDTVLWYPGGKIRKSKITHYFAVVFYHFLPALLVDILAYCCGYKPFLWKIQKRLHEGLKVLDYYTSNEWKFSVDNTMDVRNWLNSTEKLNYTVSSEGVDYKSYFRNSAYAARKYILKDPDENLPRAKRIMKILYWVDKISSTLLKILLAYLFYKYILARLITL